MLLSHQGRLPRVDPAAWVAPDATVCGDVSVSPGSRIMHGARIVAESGGTITIGSHCIVLENAVIRATKRHPCRIGDHCLIGPGAHLVGAELDDQVFVATGAAIFHGAKLGRGAEVRVHAVVHLRTLLEPGATVPIGWIAVGDPAALLPPDRHGEVWALQEPLDFPRWVYGLDRGAPDLMVHVTRHLSETLARHADDRDATAVLSS